jgi:hypothetical protein
MIGLIFGKLTVLSNYGKAKDGQTIYLCKCDCGNETKVLAGNLRRKNSTSCGCSRRKTCSIRMSTLNLRHGETNTKLWKSWKSMVERTTKPSSSHYKKYGGRGITVFEEWKVYENFARYIGHPPSEHHTIDRIDNLKGYFPGNVRWATHKEQAANRSTNVWVEIDGTKMILSEAAKVLNISKSSASRWLKQGKLKQIEQ